MVNLAASHPLPDYLPQVRPVPPELPEENSGGLDSHITQKAVTQLRKRSESPESEPLLGTRTVVEQKQKEQEQEEQEQEE